MTRFCIPLCVVLLAGCAADEIFNPDGSRAAVFRSNSTTRAFSNGRIKYTVTGEDHAIVIKTQWRGGVKLVAVLVNGAVQWFTAGSPELKAALGASSIIGNSTTTSTQ